MRVISMVPSWTETLIRAGADVVGRTRFCIHPDSKISDIPAVGGTKDLDWGRIKELAPDLLLLDREENPRWMADLAPCRYHATHVTSARDLPKELNCLADVLEASGGSNVRLCLKEFSQRWERVLERGRAAPGELKGFPGVIEWIHEPTPGGQTRFAYVIWKKPWMAAGPGTFIASVLDLLGIKQNLLWPGQPATPTLYPEFHLEDISPETVLLFSSEPFPFHKFKDELQRLGRPAALVDGESFSWFGIRSLEFLEHHLLS